MAYKLLVKTEGAWQEVGLQHLSFGDAQREARSLWAGCPYLILPA